ncbi:MAG: glycosyltransferase family 2 protein [Synechococcus sp.]
MPSGRAEAVRITALLNIRNEWPLAAVAIVHCLLHHADDLYVLDHGSQDGTAAGLARLRNSPLGERLHLYELGEPAFHEEAFRNALVEIAQASEPGWIYSLDADEFLWAPSGLRPLLAGIPPAIQCLSYPLENWVAPRDFDETRLADYGRIGARALPDRAEPLQASRSVLAIQQGRLNYFQLPFGRKVIFRPGPRAWLRAGCHELLPRCPEQTLALHRDYLRGMHLPFTGLQKLRRKSAMGRRHSADGKPPGTAGRARCSASSTPWACWRPSGSATPTIPFSGRGPKRCPRGCVWRSSPTSGRRSAPPSPGSKAPMF